MYEWNKSIIHKLGQVFVLNNNSISVDYSIRSESKVITGECRPIEEIIGKSVFVTL